MAATVNEDSILILDDDNGITILIQLFSMHDLGALSADFELFLAIMTSPEAAARVKLISFKGQETLGHKFAPIWQPLIGALKNGTLINLTKLEINEVEMPIEFAEAMAHFLLKLGHGCKLMDLTLPFREKNLQTTSVGVAQLLTRALQSNYCTIRRLRVPEADKDGDPWVEALLAENSSIEEVITKKGEHLNFLNIRYNIIKDNHSLESFLWALRSAKGDSPNVVPAPYLVWLENLIQVSKNLPFLSYGLPDEVLLKLAQFVLIPDMNLARVGKHRFLNDIRVPEDENVRPQVFVDLVKNPFLGRHLALIPYCRDILMNDPLVSRIELPDLPYLSGDAKDLLLDFSVHHLSQFSIKDLFHEEGKVHSLQDYERIFWRKYEPTIKGKPVYLKEPSQWIDFLALADYVRYNEAYVSVLRQFGYRYSENLDLLLEVLETWALAKHSMEMGEMTETKRAERTPTDSFVDEALLDSDEINDDDSYENLDQSEESDYMDTEDGQFDEDPYYDLDPNLEVEGFLETFAPTPIATS